VNQTKIDIVADFISWFGLVLVWGATAFLRIIQSNRPGALGNTDIMDGPLSLYFSKTPFSQMMPAVAGTLLFLVLTFLIRSKPEAILSLICRYVRLAVVVVAGYLVLILYAVL
jgi:magnesium-transporting ATPase (P-type)